MKRNSVHQVAQTAQEMCYRSLHNVLRRGAHERTVHARLFDKQRRVRSLVHGMRMRGESQQHIDDVSVLTTFVAKNDCLIWAIYKNVY